MTLADLNRVMASVADSVFSFFVGTRGQAPRLVEIDRLIAEDKLADAKTQLEACLKAAAGNDSAQGPIKIRLDRLEEIILNRAVEFERNKQYSDVIALADQFPDFFKEDGRAESILTRVTLANSVAVGPRFD